MVMKIARYLALMLLGDQCKFGGKQIDAISKIYIFHMRIVFLLALPVYIHVYELSSALKTAIVDRSEQWRN